MKRDYIKPGDIRGVIRIENVIEESKYKKYHCTCLRCGNTFDVYSSGVKEYLKGCSKCKKADLEKEAEEKCKSHIGEIHGDLKIIGYAGKKKFHNKTDRKVPYMVCECKCGNITEIKLVSLINDVVTMCDKCAEKYLKDGRKVLRDVYEVDGTSIASIHDRALNKNSKTGYKGVNQMKNGKYRAYITFKRKRYHLGSFDRIEDAIAARSKAEKEIFGNFIKWYAETYPDRWEKICSK